MRSLIFVAVTVSFGCGSTEPPAKPAQIDGTSGLIDATPPAGPTLQAPSTSDGFQLDLGSYVAEAGREYLQCIEVPIPAPFGDSAEPVYFTRFESQFPRFTHHFSTLYNGNAELTPPQTQPCDPEAGALIPVDAESFADESKSHSVIEPDSHFLFGAGVGLYGGDLPPGYGMLIDPAGFIATSHHILNTSTSSATMWGLLNVHVAEPGTVTHPVASIACLHTGMDVPPHGSQTITLTCTVPYDLDLVVLASHGHHYLERFEQRLYIDGETLPDPIYVSDDWDSPDIVFLNTPLRINKNDGITFTCAYENPTDTPVRYGIGAYGEMCAFMNFFALPEAGEIPVNVGGTASLDGTRVPMFPIDF